MIEYVILGFVIYIAIVTTVVSIRVGNRLRRTVSVKVLPKDIKRCVDTFSRSGWISTKVTTLKDGGVKITFIK